MQPSKVTTTDVADRQAPLSNTYYSHNKMFFLQMDIGLQIYI
jgi:hypothetical protein